MKRFYANKFPIAGMIKDGKPMVIEAGTVFTIISITGDFFNLEPIDNALDIPYPLMIGAGMLEHGFTGQDHTK